MSIANASNDLQEQREYAPHGMPRRDPATHRLLNKILGRPPEFDDKSAPKTELPPDVLHEVGKVVAQNRELAAGVPAVLEENQKIKQEMGTIKGELNGIKDALAKISQALGLNQMSQADLRASEPAKTKLRPPRGDAMPQPEK